MYLICFRICIYMYTNYRNIYKYYRLFVVQLLHHVLEYTFISSKSIYIFKYKLFCTLYSENFVNHEVRITTKVQYFQCRIDTFKVNHTSSLVVENSCVSGRFGYNPGLNQTLV